MHTPVQYTGSVLGDKHRSIVLLALEGGNTVTHGKHKIKNCFVLRSLGTAGREAVLASQICTHMDYTWIYLGG